MIPSAGKQLDALVAEKVMGWRLNGNDAPPFSTDIATAFLVVEKIRSTKTTDPEWDVRWDWKVAIFSVQPGQNWCRIYRCGPGDIVFDASRWVSEALGATEAEAICRAALLAVGHG